MARYCITAANHKNPNNHVASQFYLLEEKADGTGWKRLGSRSAKFVVDLLESNHTVLTGKIDGSSVTLGKPVEVTLRIAHNSTDFDISQMPAF